MGTAFALALCFPHLKWPLLLLAGLSPAPGGRAGPLPSDVLAGSAFGATCTWILYQKLNHDRANSNKTLS